MGSGPFFYGLMRGRGRKEVWFTRRRGGAEGEMAEGGIERCWGGSGQAIEEGIGFALGGAVGDFWVAGSGNQGAHCRPLDSC